MIDTEIRTLDNGLTSYPAISVSPISLTAYRLSVDHNGFSPLKAKGIKPPLENQEKGFLSKKGQRSIRNAVYWFLYSVDKNLIIHGNGKKKVGFLTLTLPSEQKHSDKEIKSKCLNQFLTEIRSDYDVKKYIWKAEKQENGSLHFHILTDTFLPVLDIRDKWNRIINKLGYVHEYSKKMRSLSFSEYRDLRLSEIKRKVDASDLARIKKAYKVGCSEKWRNPNSIDLESLKKVKNVGAYISKYMSKEHKGKGDKTKLSVEGRLWFSSASVSKMKNLIIEAFEPEFPEFIYMISDAKHEKNIYETDYTTTLSVPVDVLHRCGYNAIPNRFFDYAKDVFNGFRNSEFDKGDINPSADTTKPEKIEKIVEKPEQCILNFPEKLPVLKYPVDYE